MYIYTKQILLYSAVKDEAERPPTFIFASGLSGDDAISLLRLFPFSVWTAETFL